MALSHSAPEEHCHKSTVKYHHCEPVGDQYTSLEWRHLWWCERLFLQLVSRSHLCQQCCVLHGFLNSMQFSPKKSLTAVELQGLPSLILQTTGNHGGLLNDNTNCSSYPCHQIFQVHPPLSVTPNWHLLTPSNINLYTRKASPLYLLVLWPLHTNAYML